MKCEVHIQRMKVFARHGVLPQERAVGANFYVSLTAHCEVDDEAVKADRLEGVVDYSTLTHIVEAEMAQPANLLEHVAHRIGRHILHDCARVERIDVHVEKENPPLGILADKVGIRLTLHKGN